MMTEKSLRKAAQTVRQSVPWLVIGQESPSRTSLDSCRTAMKFVVELNQEWYFNQLLLNHLGWERECLLKNAEHWSCSIFNKSRYFSCDSKICFLNLCCILTSSLKNKTDQFLLLEF